MLTLRSAVARRIGFGRLIALGLLASAPDAAGQEAADPAMSVSAASLKVFVDCNRCDAEYLRQNVGFVEYVRDRAVADVHILVTTEDTGGGGLSWTAAFIGLNGLTGRDRTLTFTTAQAATDDERRKAFARIFKIGLAGYVSDPAVIAALDVTWKAPDDGGSTKKDPWNSWVFRLSANGFSNGEVSSRSVSSYGSISANRTTNEWKVELTTNGSLRTNSFKIDGDSITSRTHSWGVYSLVVKSLGPRWSAGGSASLNHSSFSNLDRAFTVAPGLEYNFFPYRESARRSLAIQYTAGVVYNDYASVTVFDRLSDTLPKQFIKASIGLKQPWGSLNVVSNFSQQLNQLTRYRETIYGNSDIRLFKGFSFNVFAEYERIGDQLSLKKDAASNADVLLRAQQLQTNYSYYLSFGVSYSFGSIFNTIVNPRFTF